MATRTLADYIAQFQTMIPGLKPAGATAADVQNRVNQALANVQSAVAASGGNITGRLRVPQPGNFTALVQGFTATTTSHRAPHPTPSAQLTPALLGRGFGSIQGRTTP